MSATIAERSAPREHPRAASRARREPAGRSRGPVRQPGRPAPGGPRRVPLRLVAAEGRLLPRAPAAPVRTSPVTGPVPRQPARPSRAPVRLTRRGRLVIAASALLVVAAVSVILAGAAQALGHSGRPARLGPGIAKIEVRPGQSLWSLAEAYDPNADTRQVIREILQLNSMSTDQVQPGQVLWMPRD